MFTFGIFFAVSLIVTIALVTVLLASGNINLNKENDKHIFFSVIGITFGICLSLSAIGYFGGTFYAYHKEIWNFKGNSIKHEMKWTTHETRTVEVADGTDSNGHTKYRTETRHYTETHGPYWTLTNEYGSESSISSDEYDQWKNIWKNEKQTGTHHGSSAFGDTSISGPIFECNWPGSFETIMPLSEVHRYVNKVRASKYSVLKFKEASKELKDKYPRPADFENFNAIINNSALVNITNDDFLLLRRTNALLGSSYEIHGIFMLFDSSVGMDVVNDVMSAWQGPNKNELVVFIGVDKDTKKMSWVKVESWMDNTTINGYVSDSILNKEFNSSLLSNTLRTVVPKYWHRKHFKDFDYLKIEVSPVIIVIVVILQFVTGIVLFFVTKSKIDDNKSFRDTYRSYVYRKF